MTATFFALGLVIGSFLNVCIHRMQRDESLVKPRSRCPRCKKPIAAYDNIPILSWVLLGGKCRHCAKSISPRYPAVELLTGLVFAGLCRRWEEAPLFAAAAAAASSALLVVAFIDWDTFLIPDVLSYGLSVAGVLASPLNPLLGDGALPRLGGSVVGALAGFLICWGVAAFGGWVFQKEAMGGGDVKLLAGVGAWTGALGAFDCLVVASLLGSLYGGFLLLTRRLKRQDPIPFGPFLSAAAIVNFFYLVPFGFPFSSPAFAEDEPPAVVLKLLGAATYKQAHDDRFREDLDLKGRRLDPGDELRTLNGALAHIALPMGAVALVGPASTVGFDRDAPHAQAAVLEGEALFALPNPLDKGWHLTVRTRAAIATAEKGVFRVKAQDDRSTLFTGLRGSLRVRAEGKTVRVRAGEELRVVYGEPPGKPRPAQAPLVSTRAFAIDGSLSGAERAWEHLGD